MKRNVLFTILLILSVNVAVFSQTPVSVPDNFIGTWWFDATKETSFPDGVQLLVSIEIKKDGTWISSAKFNAFNKSGFSFLAETGLTNGQVVIAESGYVTAATSVEIVLTRIGETQAYDRIYHDDNGIRDSQRRLLVKDEPKLPKG